MISSIEKETNLWLSLWTGHLWRIWVSRRGEWNFWQVTCKLGWPSIFSTTASLQKFDPLFSQQPQAYRTQLMCVSNMFLTFLGKVSNFLLKWIRLQLLKFRSSVLCCFKIAEKLKYISGMRLFQRKQNKKKMACFRKGEFVLWAFKIDQKNVLGLTCRVRVSSFKSTELSDFECWNWHRSAKFLLN